MTATRQRILDAGAELFRRQGYVGTGMKQIVAEANAPFGSIYHFFPKGKAQLGEEIIRSSGEVYRELAEAFFAAQPDDPAGAMRSFFAAAAEVLVETGYADACPIGTVALEVASTNDALRQATHDVFESWLTTIAGHLVEVGVDGETARSLALSTVALIEGGFMLARAARSTEPMTAAGEVAAASIVAALAATGS